METLDTHLSTVVFLAVILCPDFHLLSVAHVSGGICRLQTGRGLRRDIDCN